MTHRSCIPDWFGYYPDGFGMYPFGHPYSGIYHYTQGTLIIDTQDAKTSEVVWHGRMSGNVNSNYNLQKQIQEGIRAIMKKYPAMPPEELKL